MISVGGTTTGNTVNLTVDRVTFRTAAFIIVTGAITDGTHTVEIQESDDASSWSAVPDGCLDGVEPVITASDDDTAFLVVYLGYRRYVRAVVDSTGVIIGGTIGIIVIPYQATNAA